LSQTTKSKVKDRSLKAGCIAFQCR